MKKILLTLISILFVQITLAQTNIVNGNDGGYIYFDMPPGTYIKDIDNTFTKFLGTWKWQESNQILIFKLEKVTKYHYTQFDTYDDFIKGNYSYSTDNGLTYVVNTINQNIGNDNPETNAMYTGGTNSQEFIKLSYIDALIAKTGCFAEFTFINNSSNQMKFRLFNPHKGYISPEVPPSPNFSIPSSGVLTKQ
jgi:hypothetical protein